MFHVVFVTLSVLMAFGCSALAWSERAGSTSPWPMIGALASAICGVGLIVYGVWFLRKTRKLIL